MNEYDWSEGGTLGRGAQAKVYACTKVDDPGRRLAVKVFDKRALSKVSSQRGIDYDTQLSPRASWEQLLEIVHDYGRAV